VEQAVSFTKAAIVRSRWRDFMEVRTGTCGAQVRGAGEYRDPVRLVTANWQCRDRGPPRYRLDRHRNPAAEPGVTVEVGDAESPSRAEVVELPFREEPFA
jgi:hypothetical protein